MGSGSTAGESVVHVCVLAHAQSVRPHPIAHHVLAFASDSALLLSVLVWAASLRQSHIAPRRSVWDALRRRRTSPQRIPSSPVGWVGGTWLKSCLGSSGGPLEEDGTEANVPEFEGPFLEVTQTHESDPREHIQTWTQTLSSTPRTPDSRCIVAAEASPRLQSEDKSAGGATPLTARPPTTEGAPFRCSEATCALRGAGFWSSARLPVEVAGRTRTLSHAA